MAQNLLLIYLMKKNNPSYFWPLWFLSSLNKEDQAKIKPSTLKKLMKGQSGSESLFRK